MRQCSLIAFINLRDITHLFQHSFDLSFFYLFFLHIIRRKNIYKNTRTVSRTFNLVLFFVALFALTIRTLRQWLYRSCKGLFSRKNYYAFRTIRKLICFCIEFYDVTLILNPTQIYSTHPLYEILCFILPEIIAFWKQTRIEIFFIDELDKKIDKIDTYFCNIIK